MAAGKWKSHFLGAQSMASASLCARTFRTQQLASGMSYSMLRAKLRTSLFFPFWRKESFIASILQYLMLGCHRNGCY